MRRSGTTILRQRDELMRYRAHLGAHELSVDLAHHVVEGRFVQAVHRQHPLRRHLRPNLEAEIARTSNREKQNK